MPAHTELTYPSVVVTIHDGHFAVSAANVQEMVQLKAITHTPNAPNYVRGVTNLRGHVLPVVDMRARLGFPSASDDLEELLHMLDQREEDHVRWLTTLENAIRENTEFKLSLDPHTCAFGKWYDTYTTSNVVVAQMLRLFEAPHARIHALGKTCLQLQHDNKTAEALESIEDARTGDLQSLIQLFAQLRQALKESIREIMLVVDVNGKSIGLLVDAVESVEYLANDITETGNTVLGSVELVNGFRRRTKDSTLVQLLVLEAILGQAELIEH